MERKNIQSSIANLFNIVSLDEYESDLVEELEKNITLLEGIFSNNSLANIQELVGGELNPSNIMGTDSRPEKHNIPLYLILDIIIEMLEKSNFKTKESIIKSIEKLRILRNKASKLNFNEKFNPLEELSPKVIDNIKLSHGLFSMEMVEVEGKECISINGKIQEDRYNVKNGDVYGEVNSKTIDYEGALLYKKDAEKLEKLENQKKENLINNTKKQLNIVAQKYFKNGEIPKYWNFESSLIDKNIDPDIQMYLSNISNQFTINKEIFIKEEHILKIFNMLQEIDKIERAQELNKQNREQAINDAKKRYKNKNALWRFLNNKMNPQKMNFDNMTNEEINKLYNENEEKHGRNK